MGKDFINCPMNEAQYHEFVDALIDGETAGLQAMGRRYTLF